MDGPLVIRYCNIWDWSSEGIWTFTTNRFPFYIYGNVFHDKGPNADSNGIDDCSSTTVGGNAPHYVVNNTIYNLPSSTWYGKTNHTFIGTNSIYENNLFVGCNQEYKTDDTSQPPPGTWDYNYADANILNAYNVGIDAHSLNNTGVNPLVAPGVGGDFHIVSTIGANYPRNKGTAITNVTDPMLGLIDFSTDPDGVSRTNGWSIGAYEYGTATGKTYAPVRKLASGVTNLIPAGARYDVVGRYYLNGGDGNSPTASIIQFGGTYLLTWGSTEFSASDMSSNWTYFSPASGRPGALPSVQFTYNGAGGDLGFYLTSSTPGALVTASLQNATP